MGRVTAIGLEEAKSRKKKSRRKRKVVALPESDEKRLKDFKFVQCVGKGIYRLTGPLRFREYNNNKIFQGFYLSFYRPIWISLQVLKTHSK